MTETANQFLRRRTERSLRHFLELIKKIRPENALRDFQPNWKDHQWGIGQDGSIAGIVIHVAGWMLLTKSLFEAHGTALVRSDFEDQNVPQKEDWSAVLTWTEQIFQEWTMALQNTPDSEFAGKRDWEGEDITLQSYIVEMYEHAVYHQGQIEYLLQKGEQ